MYEDIAGRRMLVHDTATMPAATSSHTPLAASLWHTLVPVTVTKVVSIASANTAGATAAIVAYVNGTKKTARGVATLTAGAGAKVVTYNFPGGGPTAPADAWIGYAVARAAGTAAASTRLISYYHHGTRAG